MEGSLVLMQCSLLHHVRPWVSNDTHLLLASLEPSVHEPAGLLWQKRRRCGHWPGPGPPRPARPPGSRCTCPCVAGAPEEAEVESHVMPSVAWYWPIHAHWPPPCTQVLRLKRPSGCWGWKYLDWRAARWLYGKKTFPERKVNHLIVEEKKQTYFESVKTLHQKRATEQTDHILYIYFITSYRLHQCGFRVCDQDKHISVQAEFVDPAVQFCGHVNPWAARENLDSIRSQRKSDLRMSECKKLKHVSKKQDHLKNLKMQWIGKWLLLTDTS